MTAASNHAVSIALSLGAHDAAHDLACGLSLDHPHANAVADLCSPARLKVAHPLLEQAPLEWPSKRNATHLGKTYSAQADLSQYLRRDNLGEQRALIASLVLTNAHNRFGHSFANRGVNRLIQLVHRGQDGV